MNTRITGSISNAITVTLAVYDCANCGVVFAISEDLQKRRAEDGKDFYCPNGHTNFFGNSEFDKAKKRAEVLEAQNKRLLRNIADQDQRLTLKDRQIAARKGQVTKLKNQVIRGECPCCGKIFVHLERHMAKKHPDYTDDPGNDEES